MKLAVFDFDSTLMDGETLDIIAKETEHYKEIKEITEKGMKGELDFFESLTYRVSLLEGMQLEKVNEICESRLFFWRIQKRYFFIRSKIKIGRGIFKYIPYKK